ncbi:MAG: PaaI family thioesterase [Acidimicrobiia bacterium]
MDIPGPATTFGFNQALGLVVTEVGPDRVVATLEVTPAHHQPFGLVHGGVWCAAIETVTSIGAAAWWGDRGHIVGVSNHTDFIRGVREGATTTVATPIHQGRSQQLWLAEVRDDRDRLVARGQVRIQNLESSDGLGR